MKKIAVFLISIFTLQAMVWAAEPPMPVSQADNQPQGFTVTQSQAAAAQAASVVDNMNLAAATAAAPTIGNVGTTIEGRSLDLFLRLQADPESRRRFERLFIYTSIPASGSIDSLDPVTNSTIFSIVTEYKYTPQRFLDTLKKVDDLYTLLQSEPNQLITFNYFFEANVPASGPPDVITRKKLFEYFTGQLPQVPTPTPVPSPTPPGALPYLFSPTSFWNKKLPGNQPIASNSAALVNELVANTKLAQPWLNTGQWSTPLYRVNSSTPKVPVAIVQNGQDLTYTKLYQEAIKGVPVPTTAAASLGTDAHITIFDEDSGKLYEFWRFKKVNGRWEASWGGIIDNTRTNDGIMPVVRNANGGSELWGASATNLPVVAGTILIEELKTGVIPHALAFAIPRPKTTFVWPAQRSDGTSTAADAIPEGTRFRLPANTQINPSWSPIIKMIVTAARDYGMVLRDRSGAVVFYGEDPTPYGSTNPFTAYFGGLALWDVMKQFPWSQLQALDPSVH